MPSKLARHAGHLSAGLLESVYEIRVSEFAGVDWSPRNRVSEEGAVDAVGRRIPAEAVVKVRNRIDLLRGRGEAIGGRDTKATLIEPVPATLGALCPVTRLRGQLP